MAKSKSANLSAGLVAVKGEAAPAVAEDGATLNFKVSAEFRRRFRQRAAAADLKLNELLREALEAWERGRGLE
jgi:hypothetical protein